MKLVPKLLMLVAIKLLQVLFIQTVVMLDYVSTMEVTSLSPYLEHLTKETSLLALVPLYLV